MRLARRKLLHLAAGATAALGYSYSASALDYPTLLYAEHRHLDVTRSGRLTIQVGFRPGHRSDADQRTGL